MWQVKIPFKSIEDKEAALSRAYICGTAGIWEKDGELIVYLDSAKKAAEFKRSFDDRRLYCEQVSEKIDWLAHWKKFHRLIRIKPFMIVPSFRKDAGLSAPYTKKIIIHPSFAFGTGSHPTTRMCIRYIAKLVRPGMNVLDMGTGSAILAICAEKLGAGHVLGIDIDEIALAEAAKNLKRNRCSRIDLGVRLDGKKHTAAFDFCACNILCEDILNLKPLLASVLKSGADLVLSGLLAEQRDEVLERYSDRFGYVSAMKMSDRSFNWIALHLKRK